ncbi:MAG: hypothetical protein IKY52_01170 [Clostridia bacterium]|nr:hypothetical protein [Clostridia bacterium]
MTRTYTKMELLAEEVFRQKEAGETNRQIAERYGLTKYRIKQLVARQNRKKCAIENGYLPPPKDRPRKDYTAETEETKRNNELVKLRMENELLRNFLCEAGRR